jgi:HEAT repeat protein
MRASSRILAAAAALVFGAASLGAGRPADRPRPPSEVIDRSAGPGPLPSKLDRALAEAPKLAAGRAFWIGYAIDRPQQEDSRIGRFDGDGREGLTIAEILAGKLGTGGTSPADSPDVRQAAAAALERIERKGRPGKTVVKELGFFFKYGPERSPVLADVAISNLDLSFDFEGAPFIWLGKAGVEQSLGLIERLFDRDRGGRVRRDLIAAAGCHGRPALALPFLERVLSGDGPDALRKDAAFWAGEQNDAAALPLLARIARNDRSKEVREGAVFGLSRIELPAALDEIIDLAKGADKQDVREQAVFWLSQIASEKSGPVIEEIAREDDSLEIQEHALFALAELPDHQGLDALIKLARTHRDARIRKKALFWLGQCDDPRALEALIAIVKGKSGDRSAVR